MTFRINVWGAQGRWFESSHPDIVESIDNLMIVDAFCFFITLSSFTQPWNKSTYDCNFSRISQLTFIFRHSEKLLGKKITRRGEKKLCGAYRKNVETFQTKRFDVSSKTLRRFFISPRPILKKRFENSLHKFHRYVNN